MVRTGVRAQGGLSAAVEAARLSPSLCGMERIGILLSGAGTTYANLATCMRAGTLAAEVAVVVSSRADAGGVLLARSFGHPCVVASEPAEVSAALADHRAGWVAMCGWLRFWDPVAPWRERTVNIHPSLLPAFGGRGMYGLKVHAAVIACGCTLSGCTAHLVSGGYDSGPILAQRTVPVLEADTPASLQARVQAAESELYPHVLRALLAGGLKRRGGDANHSGNSWWLGGVDPRGA